MKTTAWLGLSLTLVLGSLTAAVLAQGTAGSDDEAAVGAPAEMAPAEESSESSDVVDFTTPDLNAPREYRVCPDRPSRPEWLENLPVRESYKGVLVMQIYDARSYEAIVATDDCSCVNRAPSWDTAMSEYQENYAGLDYEGHSKAESEFRRMSDSLYREARAICEAQGNW